MRMAKTIARSLAVAVICLGRQLSAGAVERTLARSLVGSRLKTHTTHCSHARPSRYGDRSRARAENVEAVRENFRRLFMNFRIRREERNRAPASRMKIKERRVKNKIGERLALSPMRLTVSLFLSSTHFRVITFKIHKAEASTTRLARRMEYKLDVTSSL